MKSITKSKIVCTLGPASQTVERIQQLESLGMDCARINFSHGTADDKRALFQRIRTLGARVSILCDIQGPKIRVGRMPEDGVILTPGSTVRITTEDVLGDAERIPIRYAPLPDEVQPGEKIFINDGTVCLHVYTVENRAVVCEVQSGGYISSRKGVNLPATEISLTVPTEKDVEDLKLIAELDPEFVAVSFVRDAEDVRTVRRLLSTYGNDSIQLIAKIERPVALKHFDEILAEADGIMVARGDLGVEIPAEQVLPVQKRMIRQCNVAGKPVIVATQMLESMVRAPVPTRAEVSDVYNAIEDGADAVMLSAETASGDYPQEAVAIMEKIIRTSESMIPSRNPDDFDSAEETVSELIGHLVFSACQEFADMGLTDAKIVCLTHTGYAARMISKYRPPLPILGITPELRTARRLKLLWGVEPLYLPELASEAAPADRLRTLVQAAVEQDYLGPEEHLIFAGNLFDIPAQINMVSIVAVADVLPSLM